MMKINAVTFKSVCSAFTEKVQELLSQGYFFWTSSRGHQGEEMKVDLTKDGKTVIRVLLEKEGYDIWSFIFILKVIEFYNEDMSDMTFWTFWNKEGKLLFKKVFYEVSPKNSGHLPIFTENKAEYDSVIELRKNRFLEKSVENYWLPDSCNRLALKLLRKRKGFKSIPLSKVSHVEREPNAYRVCFIQDCSYGSVLIPLRKKD